MAHLINLKTVTDHRGSLTVIEKILPFDIKRVFYIYDVKSKRGEHRQKITTQALIALSGSVEIFCNNGKKQESFVLNNPGQCLIVPPEDWHSMDKFSNGSVLLVLSSHEYDPQDIISERYT